MMRILEVNSGRDVTDRLNLLNEGTKLNFEGKEQIEIYAGLEWVQTCSCPCENTFQLPVMIHEENGRIIRTEQRAPGYYIIGSTDLSSLRFKRYKSLLESTA